MLLFLSAFKGQQSFQFSNERLAAQDDSQVLKVLQSSILILSQKLVSSETSMNISRETTIMRIAQIFSQFSYSSK